MAYGDNKQPSRSIVDVLSDFTKYQQDAVKSDREYGQTVLRNLADIGNYQRKIRTENMSTRRTNATQRYLEAEKFARIEEDETKLPKWLELMNAARRDLSSTKDTDSSFSQEGELRQFTMDDLMAMRKFDKLERMSNGETPTGSKPIADKLKELGDTPFVKQVTTEAKVDNTNVKGNIPVDKSKLSYSNSYINNLNIDRLKKTRDVLQKSFAVNADPYVAKNLANINNIISDLEFNQKDYDVDEDRSLYNRWTFNDGDAISDKILATRQHIADLKSKANAGGFNSNPNDYANAIKDTEETLNNLYDQYASNQKPSTFQRIMRNISTWRR